jgi:hypothetical protein
MQDKVDMHSLNDVKPAVVRPGTPVPEFIPQDRPGGDTNNSGAGPALQNDFHTLPDDAEGSDQEQDMTYDHDIDQDTAAGADDQDAASDGVAAEDSGLPPSPHPPPSPPPSSISPVQIRRHLLNYFRTALTVSKVKSGTNEVIAMLEARKVSTEVLSSANISVRDALRTQGDEAKRVILKELKQMIDSKVFRPVRRSVLTEQGGGPRSGPLCSSRRSTIQTVHSQSRRVLQRQ